MIEIFILSLIQGITEFIPISSSSHLILISELINYKNQSLSIDVSLHIGSFIAVVVYFYKDLINFIDNKILFFKILISSFPVMIIGYFLTELEIINKLRNLQTIAWTTILFGILLYISDRFKLEKNIKKDFTLRSAFFSSSSTLISFSISTSMSSLSSTSTSSASFISSS